MVSRPDVIRIFDNRKFIKCVKSGEINQDITRSEVLALKKGNVTIPSSTTKSLISIEVDETEIKRYAYTPMEKFQKLSEKNPLIENLRKEFDLDI